MLTIGIDRGDQLRKGHAALTGDLLQTVPELVFEADARLVAGNDNRALRNRRLHGFSPANQPSVLYDRKALRARNPPAWCHEAVSPSAAWSTLTCRGYRGIGNGAHNRDVRQNCYWRSLTLPISASRLNLRCSMMPSLTLQR